MDVTSYKDRLVRIESCPLCGTNQRYDLFQLEGAIPVTAVVCSRCALTYLREMLPEDVADRFYTSNDYRSIIYGAGERSLDRMFQQQYERAAPVLEFVDRHIKLDANARILDIGCSAGGFVKRFAEHGYDASGVEPSEKYSAYGRERGAAIHTTTMEKFASRGDGYDMVAVIRALNHFEQVDAILSRIHGLLRQEGHLYLEVLDFHHAIHRKSLDKCLKIDHPIMFAPETLELFLQKAGFEVVVMERDFDRNIDFKSLNHMHVIARKSEPTPIEQLNIRPDAAVHAKLTSLLRITNYQATRPASKSSPKRRIRGAIAKLRSLSQSR